jgi:hypothetical protein
MIESPKGKAMKAERPDRELAKEFHDAWKIAEDPGVSLDDFVAYWLTALEAEEVEWLAGRGLKRAYFDLAITVSGTSTVA